MHVRVQVLFCLVALFFYCCDDDPSPDEQPGSLQLTDIRVGTFDLSTSANATNVGVPIDQPVVLSFSLPLDKGSVETSMSLLNDQDETVSFDVFYLDNNKTVSLQPTRELESNRSYALIVSDGLKGENGETFPGITVAFKTRQIQLEITSFNIDGQTIANGLLVTNVSFSPTITLTFSRPLDVATATNANIAIHGDPAGTLEFDFGDENKILTITLSNELKDLRRYRFAISHDLRGAEEEPFSGLSRVFYTAVDPEPKFPVIPTNDLITLVQQQTFKYFWDFAQPASGMARERNTSGDLVTSGGSGFGLMALIVGIERNFITRAEGIERLDRILDFLESADRFHGAWSHWINGNTGNVIPFSPNDNGGDLVETSYLVQGLLTFRQYLNAGNAEEATLIDRINTLWESVEWDWYTRDGQNVLYWHWSPDKAWIMNHPIRGYNEALITYVLAASSPTHTIDADVYHEGWANNGGIVNGKSFYDITLPVGYDYGGPLFFAHYSFLGLDPRNLSDTYANYWTQNVNHSLINHAYCVDNPRNYVGYSDKNWGLTASDNHNGYSAHSPTNDLGVITPTAALSSMPYTPEESQKAMEFFYYTLGDRMWGAQGFYDAFNLTEGWVASSYLAIDQGPIILMIENHRSQLLWELFMSCPEVQDGLTKLGFTY